MLGETPPLLSWVAVVVCAIAGWTVAILLLRRATQRLVFWL
jgi:ABC-type polysaccharide/polyol phosphate export permease